MAATARSQAQSGRSQRKKMKIFVSSGRGVRLRGLELITALETTSATTSGFKALW